MVQRSAVDMCALAAIVSAQSAIFSTHRYRIRGERAMCSGFRVDHTEDELSESRSLFLISRTARAGSNKTPSCETDTATYSLEPIPATVTVKDTRVDADAGVVPPDIFRRYKYIFLSI